MVDCKYWKECGIKNGGCCQLKRGNPDGRVNFKFCELCIKKGQNKTQEEIVTDLENKKAEQIKNLMNNSAPKNILMLPPPRDIPVEEKPTPTIKQMGSFFQALALGKRVSLDVIQERESVCRSCDNARKTEEGELWCGICGCGVAPDDKKIRNLAAYEENLPIWGCKHPERHLGKGWPIKKEGI